MTIWGTFYEHQGRQIDKWRHYFDIYEKHFARFRDTAVRVLEIGIDHGGSLQLWKEYFGVRAQIVGVDIVNCTRFAEPQIEIVVADQCKLPDLGDFDIIIDDGSHICAHQSITFRKMWPHCRSVYLIEDCHNGYPLLDPHPPIQYRYPWIVVAEKPQRIIKGTPSRELRPDEVEARSAAQPSANE